MKKKVKPLNACVMNSTSKFPFYIWNHKNVSCFCVAFVVLFNWGYISPCVKLLPTTISCNFRTISYFPASLWLTIDRLPNFWAVTWSYQGLTNVNHCIATFARLHGKWLWLTFDRLLSFCPVTWYHLCVLPLLRGYMVSVGKFFSGGRYDRSPAAKYVHEQ